ncbi:MAG: NhaA family Na+:H+ antiporter [Halieaceae bacterium]|jgi:NhaA family Na+:H+ antiporter
MSRPIEKQSFINEFFQAESAGGIVLMFTAVLALVMANSPLAHLYSALIDTPVSIRVGDLAIDKPMLLWINDGLMAIFFFLIGLELKRELVEGELSDIRSVILPGVGAIGGMVIPAAIYIIFNRSDAVALNGWAIPAATDIAFALAILSLLGPGVPTSLKIFLTSLAIFDDIGAVIIIAIFYTSDLSLASLSIVALCVVVLAVFNWRGVDSRSLYLCVGLVMWVATLKSGVHATLAGVVLAMFIPLRSERDPEHSPLRDLEHDLHSLVAYLVLPVFAFANAGISLSGVGPEQLLHNVPMGIAMGLFVGKQIGIFGLCWVVIKLGWVSLPSGISWLMLYGAAALCGVGFTMSMFIGSLAFEQTGVNLLFDERLGIIVGSVLSGLLGYAILRISIAKGTKTTAQTVAKG